MPRHSEENLCLVWFTAFATATVTLRNWAPDDRRQEARRLAGQAVQDLTELDQDDHERHVTAKFFRETLRKALADGSTNEREVADRYEAAYSSVRRWCTGISEPMPAVQRMIVDWLYTLRGQSVITEGVFQEVIIRAFEAGVTEADISRAIGVSRPTIQRWRDGLTAPLLGVRMAAIRELDELISMKMPEEPPSARGV